MRPQPLRRRHHGRDRRALRTRASGHVAVAARDGAIARLPRLAAGGPRRHAFKTLAPNGAWAVAVGCCVILGAASAAALGEPVYDAWAWLVWGRELTTFDLDTSSGPSWKPLAVLLTALLAVGGAAAPTLWLGLVQTAWLLSLVLACHLAFALTGQLHRHLRLAAAAFAVVSLLLLGDGATMWTRQGAAGMSEPLAVALSLGAAAAAVARRARLALIFAALVALLRPEAWPLLVGYGLWVWRDEPALHPWIAGVTITVPALWLVPDLLASGDAPGGATRARRRDTGMPLNQGAELLARAAAMPLAVAWPLALFGAIGARSRHLLAARAHQHARLALAAGAAGWILIVAVMAAAGYSGLARYCAPAAAMIGVVAAVGFAHLLALAHRRYVIAALLLAVLAAAGPQLPARVGDLEDGLADVSQTSRSNDRLRSLTRAIGRQRLLRCGTLMTSDVRVRTALAWQLDVPLKRVVSIAVPPPAPTVVVIGPDASTRLRRAMRSSRDLLGASGEWRVYSRRC